MHFREEDLYRDLSGKIQKTFNAIPVFRSVPQLRKSRKDSYLDSTDDEDVHPQEIGTDNTGMPPRKPLKAININAQPDTDTRKRATTSENCIIREINSTIPTTIPDMPSRMPLKAIDINAQPDTDTRKRATTSENFIKIREINSTIPDMPPRMPLKDIDMNMQSDTGEPATKPENCINCPSVEK